MPLVAATVLAYAAGLFAGFAEGSAALLGAGVIAFASWQVGRSARDRMLICAIGVAAAGVAMSARGQDARCRSRLARETEWRGTIATDAEPGALVVVRSQCGSVARMAVGKGEASSGARVVARGKPTQGRNGPLLIDVNVTQLEGPALLARWRAAVGRGIDAHFGEDAPLVRALLIADMNDVPPSVRDRFAAAGISHMLSVSGLHVGLIAMAVLLLAQVAGLCNAAAQLTVVLVCVAYVAVIGAPLPAVRAAVMLAVGTMSRTLQRPTSAWAVLAVGAGLPLLDSSAVLDVGYQLSVVGMVALIASAALARRIPWLSVGGARGTILRGVATSIVATLLTAPIVAATFGRVSLIAPLTNLVAAPIIALLQPMLFLAAALLPLSPLAQFVADACHPLLGSLDRVATVAASMPGASVTVVGDQTAVIIASLAAAAFVVAAVSRFPGRALVIGAACLAALAWRPIIALDHGWTELHMIDVGQGDALALRTRAGRWVLFDAGRDWIGGDAGTRDVIPYLQQRGGSLVAFVLSHPHADHVGGAAATLKALHPGVYFDPGYAGGSGPYRESLLEAQRDGISWRRVHPGDSLTVDEATLTFLAPDSAWAESQHDPNLASAVVRIRIGSVSVLMTGDAEAPEEDWLLAHDPHGASLAADVLKVAHHGSKTSSSAAFLDAVQPRVALISVGAGNMYGHPSASVIDALTRRGATVLRTDRSGSVVVRTDGMRIEIEAEKERWQLPRR